MKFKTLLLGTAAAFAVAGSAQAADLAVAESVEYVKVCDAYGAGYFYVPGSDVCLKIGGYVLFDTDFYSHKKSLNYEIPPDPPDYFASWKFYTEEEINTTAKWMTDWGAATILIAVRANHDQSTVEGSGVEGAVNALAYLDTAYLKIGGLLAGYNGSTYDWGFNGLIGYESPFDHDLHQNQLQWSTTIGGLGFFLALEDPRDNVGASDAVTGDMPDIVAALTGSSGAFSWKWSAGVTDTHYGTGWGTQIGVGWAQGANFFKVQAAVGNDAGAGYAANWAPNGAGGTPWHVSAQGGIAWSSAFTTLLGASYRAQNGVNEWEASAEADWQLSKGVAAGIAVTYDDPNTAATSTTVDARIKASF